MLINLDDLKKLSSAYTDSRYEGKIIENWSIIKYSNSYIREIIKDFEVEASPRIYFLKPFTFIPFHTDNETKCSINFLLSDHNAPIIIENKVYFYKQALLDTTKKHGLKNGNEERILLKLSIFNESFDELARRIKYRI